MSKDRDPDWPSKEDMKEPEHLSFWQFLVGFVLLEVVVWAMAAFCSGCTTTPEGDVTITVPAAAVDFATNAIRDYIDSHKDSPAADAKMDGAPTSGAAGESASSQPQQDAPAVEQVKEQAAPSVVLDWKYGGFKGGKATEDARCRLGSPKITKDKISYKWLTKIPEDWKRQDTDKGPMVIAAAFYWDGSQSKWVGGKFDFCDESRSSRSCANINKEHYNGWDASAWGSAKRRAFCVVSADGKYRSNLIED